MAEGRGRVRGLFPAVVVVKTYDFLLWLLPKVEKSQRSFRFTVSDRMVGVGLDLLLALVKARSCQSADRLLCGSASCRSAGAGCPCT